MARFRTCVALSAAGILLVDLVGARSWSLISLISPRPEALDPSGPSKRKAEIEVAATAATAASPLSPQFPHFADIAGEETKRGQSAGESL